MFILYNLHGHISNESNECGCTRGAISGAEAAPLPLFTNTKLLGDWSLRKYIIDSKSYSHQDFGTAYTDSTVLPILI
jgi:hypothetical protein